MEFTLIDAIATEKDSKDFTSGVEFNLEIDSEASESQVPSDDDSEK